MTFKLNAISEGYDRQIAAYHTKVGSVTNERGWHLRVVWLPDGKPEVIYSISHQDCTARITLVRFLESKNRFDTIEGQLRRGWRDRKPSLQVPE